MSVLAGVGGVLTGLGPLVNAFIQWKGIKEGRREARRAEQMNLRLYRESERTRRGERSEDIALTQRARKEDLAFRNRQFEFEREEAERRAGLEESQIELQQDRFENEKEMQSYTKSLNFVNGMMNQLNQKPQMAANFTQIQRGRR